MNLTIHRLQAKKIIQRTVKKLPSNSEIRKQASKRIHETQVKDIRPALFKQVENRTRKEAGAFLVKGDFENSVKSKMKEVFNHQMYREANVESKDVTKRLDKSKKRLRKSDKEL